MKALVWPVAMYGCETWTLRINKETRLDAFKIKGLRKILRVSWTAKKTNEWILTFAAVIRKFTFTLYDCIRNSSNSLLIGIIAYVQSDLFYQSKLLLKWRKLLYTCMD